MELNQHERKLLELLVAEREKGYGVSAGWMEMGDAYSRCGEYLTMYPVSDFDRAYELIYEAGLTEKSDEGRKVRATISGVSLIRAMKRRQQELASRLWSFRYWKEKILDNFVAASIGSIVGSAVTLLVQSCPG
jgi:hypothetical protein